MPGGAGQVGTSTFECMHTLQPPGLFAHEQLVWGQASAHRHSGGIQKKALIGRLTFRAQAAEQRQRELQREADRAGSELQAAHKANDYLRKQVLAAAGWLVPTCMQHWLAGWLLHAVRWLWSLEGGQFYTRN